MSRLFIALSLGFAAVTLTSTLTNFEAIPLPAVTTQPVLRVIAASQIIPGPHAISAAAVYDCAITRAAIDAVACTIYHEGRSEDEVGQWLKAKVAFNRLHQRGYPHSITAVVWQPYAFSWTVDHCVPAYDKRRHAIGCHLVDKRVFDRTAWAQARRIAVMALHGKAPSQAAALFRDVDIDRIVLYHEVNIHPKWAKAPAFQYGPHLYYYSSAEQERVLVGDDPFSHQS